MHYAVDPAVDPQVTREGTTVHYIIETKGSTFTVRAFAAGILSALGHNPTISIPDFEGEVFMNPEEMEKSSFRLVIPSASLTVTGDISQKDRDDISHKMHGDVLESDSYSEILYECNSLSASKTSEGQYWAALNGELTLRGIRRNQAVSARVSVNEMTLRAMGDFSIRQSDYEIRPVTALGGAVKLKDELKFSFDITARKPA